MHRFKAQLSWKIIQFHWKEAGWMPTDRSFHRNLLLRCFEEKSSTIKLSTMFFLQYWVYVFNPFFDNLRLFFISCTQLHPSGFCTLHTRCHNVLNFWVIFIVFDKKGAGGFSPCYFLWRSPPGWLRDPIKTLFLSPMRCYETRKRLPDVRNFLRTVVKDNFLAEVLKCVAAAWSEARENSD